jgi:hypothetical protein
MNSLAPNMNESCDSLLVLCGCESLCPCVVEAIKRDLMGWLVARMMFMNLALLLHLPLEFIMVASS